MPTDAFQGLHYTTFTPPGTADCSTKRPSPEHLLRIAPGSTLCRTSGERKWGNLATLAATSSGYVVLWGGEFLVRHEKA